MANKLRQLIFLKISPKAKNGVRSAAEAADSWFIDNRLNWSEK